MEETLIKNCFKLNGLSGYVFNTKPLDRQSENLIEIYPQTEMKILTFKVKCMNYFA